MGPFDSTSQPLDSAKSNASKAFDPDLTLVYQTRMRRAPKWFCSFLASGNREKSRMRHELGKIQGAIPLLMKPRNGGKWTAQEKLELKRMLRAASAISPYLVIWALPGSVLLLPFLAWHLDARRKERERKAAAGKLSKEV